jgi:hypothetical protein
MSLFSLPVLPQLCSYFKGPHKPNLTRIVVDTCPAPADGPRIDLNDITGSLQNLLTRWDCV